MKFEDVSVGDIVWMRTVASAELAGGFGELARAFAECRYGERIAVDREQSPSSKPSLTGWVERVYWFRLRDHPGMWWELELVRPCVGHGPFSSFDPPEAKASVVIGYTVWRLADLGAEVREEDRVAEGRLESDAVLPYLVDRQLMERAIEAIRGFDADG